MLKANLQGAALGGGSHVFLIIDPGLHYLKMLSAAKQLPQALLQKVTLRLARELLAVSKGN